MMREDHSVMRVGDEAKQDKTPRGRCFWNGKLWCRGRGLGGWWWIVKKTFRKLILFCVFAKSTSFVKLAVKKVRNPRPGRGAFFMN